MGPLKHNNPLLRLDLYAALKATTRFTCFATRITAIVVGWYSFFLFQLSEEKCHFYMSLNQYLGIKKTPSLSGKHCMCPFKCQTQNIGCFCPNQSGSL